MLDEIAWLLLELWKAGAVIFETVVRALWDFFENEPPSRQATLAYAA